LIKLLSSLIQVSGTGHHKHVYKMITSHIKRLSKPLSFLIPVSAMSSKSNKWEAEKQRRLDLSLEDRRKEYFCKDFVQLSDIKSWKEEAEETTEESVKENVELKSELLKDLEINEELDLSDKISIYEGDITRLEIDAIVNAANHSLMGGGGVDGAIHRAAGSLLVEENRTHGGCLDGDAVISGGYRLPAKYIISTVGPRGENTQVLDQAYTNCLLKMKENDLRSIAFPCISTGIYGYPNDAACNVALRAVRRFLDEHHQQVDRVIFCLFLPVDVKLYRERMPLMFPITKQ